MKEEADLNKQKFIREAYRLSNKMLAENIPPVRLALKHNSLTFYGDCMFRYGENENKEDLYIRGTDMSLGVLDKLAEIYNKEFGKESIISPEECLRRCLADLTEKVSRSILKS